MTCETLRWAAVPALLWMTAAGAQSADPPVLEEIIVTATKREVALQDLPLSVGVLTGDQLDRAGLSRLEDYWRSVPSLAVRDGPFGGNEIVIRGLIDSDSFQATESLNAFYIDDTPLTYVSSLFATAAEPTLVDVAQVEVLRGPQGTVVGANAMGGALRVLTREPDPSRVERTIDAQLDQTAHGGLGHRVSVVYNQPLVDDRSAIRLVAFRHQDSGYIDDIGLDQRDINEETSEGVRVAFATRIGDSLELVARLHAEDRKSGGYDYRDPVGKPDVGLVTTTPYQVALLVDEQVDSELNLASLRLSWDTAIGEFVSVSSWFEKDNVGVFDWSPEFNEFFGFRYPVSGPFARFQEDFTQEVRLSGSSGAGVDWLVGAFYLDQDARFDDQLLAPGLSEVLPFLGEVLLDFDSQVQRQDTAVFGEVNWQVAGDLTLTLGARWYDIDQEQVTTGFFADFPLDDQARGRIDDVVSRAALSWDASPDALIYLLASNGFRPGQFNSAPSVEVCGSRPVIESDELWNYEFGYKSAFMDHRITLNATAYFIDWSDIQTNVFNPDCGFVVLENAGEAESRGFEVELGATVNNRLKLQAGLGFNDVVLTRLDPTSERVPNRQLPNAPKWTASLSALLDWPLNDGMTGYAHVQAQFVDSRFTSFNPQSALEFGSPVELGEYGLLNVRAGIDRKPWRAEIFVNNVFDEDADVFCCRFDTETTIVRPRTVGLRTVISF